MRRTFNLSKRHDGILQELSNKLDVSMTEVVNRALEALEEKEAKRGKEVSYDKH